MSIDELYKRVSRLCDMAEKCSDVNWNADADLLEQAERLDEVATVANEAAGIALAVNNALVKAAA